MADPKDVTDAGIDIDCRLVQYANELFPIVVTPSGMVTLVKPWQAAKA